MTVPFRKHQDDGVGVGQSPPVQRKSDHGLGLDMLGAVAKDLLHAVKMNDETALKSVLEALVDHIMTIDEEQDNETFGEME